MTTADPETVDVPSRSSVAAQSGWWDKAREFYRLLLPIRFSFLTLVVFAVALLLTDQGKDAIAALAEGKAGSPWWGVLGVQVLFAVLVALFAAQAWYWSRQLLRIHFQGQPDPARWPITVSWGPRLLGLAVFAIAILGLNGVRRTYDGVMRKPAFVLLVIMIALAIEAALFVFFVILRRKMLGPLPTVPNLKALGPVTLRILGLTALLAVVVFFGSTFAVQRLARIGTMSILLTSLGLWVSLGGLLVYAGMKARIPILTWLLLFAIIISPLADNHAVRTTSGGVPPRAGVDAAFATWYGQLVADTQGAPAPRPVFIVATEGGGIRAAYWTAAVLTSLSDTVPGFTQHLFAVSGVSGGSLGAVTYRALLAEPAGGPIRKHARNALGFDALAPTISAFTQQDFVQRFLFVPILPDRAKALEQGWELGWSNALNNEHFGNGFLATVKNPATEKIPAADKRLPSLFLNGTLVETGQRVITSNVRIDGRLAGAVDAFDIIGKDVPLSTAAHNSARFPYVSPVGTIPQRHIADGGYFENSGAGTAADLVEAVRRHPHYKAGLIRPYVIFIDCQCGGAPVEPARVANELIAPIRTLFGTRGAHATSAVAELREQTPRANWTAFTLVQHKGERFPLGWLLAARTRDLIDKQMGPLSVENGKNVTAIAAALGGVTPGEDKVWKDADDNEKQAKAEERQ